MFSCNKNQTHLNPKIEWASLNKAEIKPEVANTYSSFKMDKVSVETKSRYIIDSLVKAVNYANGITGKQSTQHSQSVFLTERSYYDGDCPNRNFLLKFRWIVIENTLKICSLGSGGFYPEYFDFILELKSPYLIVPVNQQLICDNGFAKKVYTFDVYFLFSELEYSSITKFRGQFLYNGLLDLNTSLIPAVLNYCALPAVGGVSRIPSTSTTAIVYTEASIDIFCIWPNTIIPANCNFKFRPIGATNWFEINNGFYGGIQLSGLDPNTSYEYELVINYANTLGCSSLVKVGLF